LQTEYPSRIFRKSLFSIFFLSPGLYNMQSCKYKPDYGLKAVISKVKGLFSSTVLNQNWDVQQKKISRMLIRSVFWSSILTWAQTNNSL